MEISTFLAVRGLFPSLRKRVLRPPKTGISESAEDEIFVKREYHQSIRQPDLPAPQLLKLRFFTHLKSYRSKTNFPFITLTYRTSSENEFRQQKSSRPHYVEHALSESDEKTRQNFSWWGDFNFIFIYSFLNALLYLASSVLQRECE